MAVAHHRVADEQHAVEQVVVDELRDVAAEPRQHDGFAGQRPRLAARASQACTRLVRASRRATLSSGV